LEDDALDEERRRLMSDDQFAWRPPTYFGEEPYLWTEDMQELSGFGGGYEDACRMMLQAGLAWFDAHPKAIVDFREAQGVYGWLKFTSDQGKEFEKAIVNACPDGPTGAMVHCVTRAVHFIRAKSWAEWCERKRANRIQEREEEKKGS
jgi:hypothetical protein